MGVSITFLGKYNPGQFEIVGTTLAAPRCRCPCPTRAPAKVAAVPQMTATYRKGRLIQALFTVLKEHPEGLAAKDAISAVEKSIELDTSEKGAFEQTGQEKFPRLIRFATIPATKAGWMVKHEGTWTVTDEGLQAGEQFPDAEQFFKQARQLYLEWKKATKPAAAVDDSDDEEATDEEIDSAVSLEDDEDAARAEILDFLAKMPPYDFQTCCAKLVQALGHEIAWISPPGPDGGLDFVAFADPIGATGRRVKGQAKRQQSKQDVGDVGAFLSKLKGDDVGVFIALGGFTRNAEMEARAYERRCVLLDGADFVRLWIEHHDHLDEEAKALLRLRPVWRLVRPVD
jgi:restriction system protein